MSRLSLTAASRDGEVLAADWFSAMAPRSDEDDFPRANLSVRAAARRVRRLPPELRVLQALQTRQAAAGPAIGTPEQSPYPRCEDGPPASTGEP